jgi:type I restriction enzyme S subunit
MLESLDLKRFAASTGVPSLNRNFVHPTPVFLPPLDEQSRIAVVLDTVDEAIAKTEGMIAKLKQVHAGLLHDLLTRGLDEYGQLRDPIAHPEQFQDSSVGRIPRKWRVCGVLDVAPSDRQAILTGPFGAQLGQADFVREGIPVLRIGNVQSGYIDLSDLQFVTEEKAQTLERFRIKYGDLLFARQGATTGRNALADERVEGYIINYHIIRVAVNRDSCSPVFLQALFNSENVRRQINRDKGRGTREGINTGEITALRFALPSIEEQHHAVSVICAQSQLVEAEVELLGKLHLIKAGLISDLLTGRVRVPESISAVENQP